MRRSAVTSSITIYGLILLALSASIDDAWADGDDRIGELTVRAKRLESALAEPRFFHAAASLPDGRVLICGGAKGMFPGLGPVSARPEITSSSDIYDPDTRRFEPGPPMAIARMMHTATALPDGRVAVMGGEGTGTVEIYDPDKNAFVKSGRLRQPRMHHQATLLKDGRILVSGGIVPNIRNIYGPRRLDVLEIYDPKTGESTPVADRMTVPRTQHAALRLPDGRVLLIGGTSRDVVDSFDPKTGKVHKAGQLIQGRRGAAVGLTSKGRAIVAGGDRRGRSLETVELFDPDRHLSTRLDGRLDRGTADMVMVPLGDDRFALIGGETNGAGPGGRDVTRDRVYVVDVRAKAVKPVGRCRVTRDDSTATRLPDGSILVVGGEDDREQGRRCAEILYIDNPKDHPRREDP